MKQHKLKYPVELMCKVLNTSKSGYYNWLSSGPSKRWNENQEIMQVIHLIFEDSYQSYGSPRMAVELEKRGFKVSRPRTARMMKASSLQARRRRKFKHTTDSNHNYPIAPNRLNRRFRTERRNSVWVSDITYIETSQGWLYLTVIIDLFDRKVIGWARSENMTAESTVIKAWYMAVGNRPIKNTLIFHSDRGSQYACTKFRNILKSYEFVQQSMSRKGNCWDNAVAESFFKSLKTEWVSKNEYLRKTDAEMSIFKWIETWYNRNRRHSVLNYKTIKEFELEIINYKWIAMFPEGQEAWSEYRRTGYPKIFPVVSNQSGGDVDTDIQIRRIPFVDSEKSTNAAGITGAISLLGGADNGGRQLWWDTGLSNF